MREFHPIHHLQLVLSAGVNTLQTSSAAKLDAKYKNVNSPLLKKRIKLKIQKSRASLSLTLLYYVALIMIKIKRNQSKSQSQETIQLI